MKFTKLVPNVFYTDINTGLRLFVDCLGFRISYDELASDAPFCAIERDGLSMLLFQNAAFAEKDRPEFRLVTNDIEEVYRKVSSTHPEFLHPNLRQISVRPWGAKEFALKDDSNVCVIIQQW